MHSSYLLTTLQIGTQEFSIILVLPPERTKIGGFPRKWIFPGWTIPEKSIASISSLRTLLPEMLCWTKKTSSTVPGTILSPGTDHT